MRRDFERQVSKELNVLYRVARRMGCKPEEAEDCVQTCLLKAFQAWERFDGRHLRSWLITILRNERLMAIRSQKPEISLEESNVEEGIEEPFWDEVSWKMQAERILEELEHLPENFRMTLHLCDVEQMTYEEAAKAMDVPIGTVRSRLFRAREMLRKRLTPVGTELSRATT